MTDYCICCGEPYVPEGSWICSKCAAEAEELHDIRTTKEKRGAQDRMSKGKHRRNRIKEFLGKYIA